MVEKIELGNEIIIKDEEYKGILNTDYPEYGFTLWHRNQLVTEGIPDELHLSSVIGQMKMEQDPRVTHHGSYTFH